MVPRLGGSCPRFTSHSPPKPKSPFLQPGERSVRLEMADACAPGRRCRHLGLLVTLGSAGVRDRRGLPAQRGRLTLDRGTHGVGQLSCWADS